MINEEVAMRVLSEPEMLAINGGITDQQLTTNSVVKTLHEPCDRRISDVEIMVDGIYG